MKSLFSRLFCMLFLVGIANLNYAQTNNRNGNYNLPPGYYLNPNQQIFDLSFKLDGLVLEKEIPASQLQVLKEISDEQLSETSLEYQQYVQAGRDFINSLSDNVKSIYREVELWYIYVFDGELKNKLIQIQ